MGNVLLCSSACDVACKKWGLGPVVLHVCTKHFPKGIPLAHSKEESEALLFQALSQSSVHKEALPLYLTAVISLALNQDLFNVTLMFDADDEGEFGSFCLSPVHQSDFKWK